MLDPGSSCTVTGDCGLSQCTLEDDGACSIGGDCNVTGGSSSVGTAATFDCRNLSVDHGRIEDNGTLHVTGDTNFSDGTFKVDGYWIAEGRKIQANDSSWVITPHGQARNFVPWLPGFLSLNHCTLDVNGKLDVYGDANFTGGNFNINTGAAATIDGNFFAVDHLRSTTAFGGRFAVTQDEDGSLWLLFGDGVITAGGKISVANSSFQIGPHGALDSGSQIILQGGSSLSGSGTVTAPDVIIQDSQWTSLGMNINGNMQLNNAVVNLAISNNSPGAVVTGGVNFNGTTINVSLVNFVPPAHTQILALSWGSFGGNPNVTLGPGLVGDQLLQNGLVVFA